MLQLGFFKGKKIFVTGHTGFKGSWLCQILLKVGADVKGYGLAPNTKPNLFEIIELEKRMKSVIGDIRDLNSLKIAFDEFNPEFVIHLAAQPIVRDSYDNPVYTYETNVMGTVNIMECIRLSKGVRSFLNVTTDKVYQNNEWEWGYRENEVLDGFDPYSNSKSCSELVTNSYRRSFFSDVNVAIGTARAGNVIGGGDFANDRIIPDCVRVILCGKEIVNIRNPHSIRPYQHVLEPLFAYLLILQKQSINIELASSYNVGPEDRDCVTTAELVEFFCEKWGNGITWDATEQDGPHEANFLKLDSSKLKKKLGWNTKWTVEKAVEKTVEWTKNYLEGNDVVECMNKQIKDFIGFDEDVE